MAMQYRMFDTDRSGTINFDEFWYADFLLDPSFVKNLSDY